MNLSPSKAEIVSAFKRLRSGNNGRSWKDLSVKLQQNVISHLDLHSLLNCRLVSRSLKLLVDKTVEEYKFNPGLLWNPYYFATTDTDSNLNSVKDQLLGTVFFYGTGKLKELYAPAPPPPVAAPPPKPLPPSPPPVTVEAPKVKTPPAPSPTPHPLPPAHPKKVVVSPAPPPPTPPKKAAVAPSPTPSPSKVSRPLTPPPAPPSYRRSCQSCQQKALAQKSPSVASHPPKSTLSLAKPLQVAAKPKNVNIGMGKAVNSVNKLQKPTRPNTAPSNFSTVSTSRAKSAPTIAAPKPKLVAKPPTPVNILNTRPASKVTILEPCTTCRASPPPLAPAVPQPTVEAPAPAPVLPHPHPAQLIPLGAVHITRGTSNPLELGRYTLDLVKEYGEQITSFTFDDGLGERSHLTFEYLSSLLAHLPNLLFLGITAGNYEHHVDIEDILALEEKVEQLPALAHLQFVSLGYNSTYHLHMDILNAYGCQLKRFVCSKFGYFLRSPFGYHVSTNNSLQRLLEYTYSVRDLYPSMLSSLEELKVPVISSQGLLRTLEQAPTSVQWSSLKSLSLYYIHRGDGYNECCLADLWELLNQFASSLEELYVDFQGCSDFVEWITADVRPLPVGVFEPLPKVKKLYLSALTLLRSDDMATLVATKFPNLEKLSFFKWKQYHEEAIQSNNQMGKYFNGGPTPVTISGHMGHFWKDLPLLQKVSIRTSAWKDNCIYSRTRDEMKFVEKGQATYIY